MIHIFDQNNLAAFIYEIKPEDFNKIAFYWATRHDHLNNRIGGWLQWKLLLKAIIKVLMVNNKKNDRLKMPSSEWPQPTVIDYMFLLVWLTILFVSQLLIRELYSGHTSVSTHSGDSRLLPPEFNDNCRIYVLQRSFEGWRHRWRNLCGQYWTTAK